MKTTHTRWSAGLVLGVLFCLTGTVLVDAGQQSNSQYIVPKEVVDAAGQPGQSATYRHNGSLGQSSAIGGSSNALYINYGGFWGGGSLTPAVFYRLTVVKSGSGTGTVTGPGIDCGADCTEQYPDGTVVILQAQEDVDSIFVEWQDEGGNPITGPIVVTQDITVTAVFDNCPWPAAFSYLTPPDGANNQSQDVDLDWEDAAGATSYTVYFGSTFPAPFVTTVTTSTYDPGPLAQNTTYYWKIAAENTCGTTEGAEWLFSTGGGTNHPPVITSTPPFITGRVYTYDVEANDPDNDPLTFSLLTAPAGMTTDAQTELITWEPTINQLGDHQVEVQVSDGQGGVDTQTFTLSVRAEILSSATIGFYAGFNAENGQATCDPEALVLVPGTMEETEEILLPGPNLFDFPAPMHFHVEYEPSPTGPTVLVLEPGVTGLLLNKPYDMVDENDIAGLSAWPTGKHVRSSDTVILLTPGGTYVKVGNFQDNPNAWTVSFNYAELQP